MITMLVIIFFTLFNTSATAVCHQLHIIFFSTWQQTAAGAATTPHLFTLYNKVFIIYIRDRHIIVLTLFFAHVILFFIIFKIFSLIKLISLMMMMIQGIQKMCKEQGIFLILITKKKLQQITLNMRLDRRFSVSMFIAVCSS